MNLPNKLTLLRVILVPVFMVFAAFGRIGTAEYNPTAQLVAGIIFAVASFTPAVGLIALLVFGFVAPTNIPLIVVCGLLFKFGSGLTLGATTVMLADVIDYGEIKLGTRNESIVASFQTLLVKTASAVAGWLIGVGLTICGYVENVPQTATTIMGMRILMGVVPSIVTILAFVIYVKGYKLDSKTMENISRQLKEKNKVSN